MLAVAGLNAAPAVDHDVWAEGADHADHIFEGRIAPDFHGLRGAFGVAEIRSAGEELGHAIVLAGG